MAESTRFSPETRRQIVHMVLDSLSEYDSQWLFSLPLSQKLAVHQKLYVSGYTYMTGNGDSELTGKFSIMSKNKQNKGEIKEFLLEKFIKKYKSQKKGVHSWKKSVPNYQNCDAIKILKQEKDNNKKILFNHPK